METGYIKIAIDENNKYIVEATLKDGELWMSKHEIAYLLNVFVNTINANIKSIFKSGLLNEEDVTLIKKYVNNGRQSEVILYNLEALIFVSYRISSYESRAFREWVMKALTEYTRTKPKKEKEVLIVYNLSSKLPVISLN